MSKYARSQLEIIQSDYNGLSVLGSPATFLGNMILGTVTPTIWNYGNVVSHIEITRGHAYDEETNTLVYDPDTAVMTFAYRMKLDPSIDFTTNFSFIRAPVSMGTTIGVRYRGTFVFVGMVVEAKPVASVRVEGDGYNFEKRYSYRLIETNNPAWTTNVSTAYRSQESVLARLTGLGFVVATPDGSAPPAALTTTLVPAGNPQGTMLDNLRDLGLLVPSVRFWRSPDLGIYPTYVNYVFATARANSVTTSDAAFSDPKQYANEIAAIQTYDAPGVAPTDFSVVRNDDRFVGTLTPGDVLKIYGHNVTISKTTLTFSVDELDTSVELV